MRDQKTNRMEQPSETVPSVTKQKAAELAAEFIKNEYNQKAELRSFTTYQSNRPLISYLQIHKRLGPYEEAYRDRYPLDYFQVELSGPGRHNRYIVDVNFHNGRIIGWETRTAAEPHGSEVRVGTAKAFLEKMGYNPEQFTLIQEKEEGKLIFEHRKEAFAGIRLQLHLTLHRDRVASFHPVFPVPENELKWIRDQDEAAQWMSLAGSGLTFAMTMMAVVYTVRGRRSAAFSRGIVLTLLFTVIYCANNINLYPGFKAMSGSGPEALIAVLLTHLIVFMIGVAVYFCLIAGEHLWRQAGVSVWPRWSDPAYGRHVMTAMGRGYLICLILLGAQAVLFLIAERYFGVWSTSDPVSSPYNMFRPELFPLLAWSAAISEEAIYRLFGIVVFKKIVKNTFLAVLLPSAVWALGHTQYPIYPVYTRLAEVTVLGLIFGYAFLKFGFLAALFAHAAMDSILMGLSITGLGTASSFLSGLFYIVLPACVGCAIAFCHGLFRKDDVPPYPEARG